MSWILARVRVLDGAAFVRRSPRPLRTRERADSVHVGMVAGVPDAVNSARGRGSVSEARGEGSRCRRRRGGGLARRATVRQTEGPEHVETYDRPAEGAQMVVDLVHESAIAPAAIGRARLVGTAPLPPTAIQDDLDGRIARKHA